ncbi:C-GCAxxG-C-C family protein [Desulfovibrio sp. TomC]|uniref:C-GCAxxG-C-C family protein n=1 Tax=Desulfovibrio sp. TomC TaxID=1562888 RepID=UPI00057536EC|nr:C-GCAxxG-C-C family protein [Desulfovibrio sp. TomC]KHK01577.1 C_GCAxxG_C_C family protein [Desulfovibrio sp. TomC]
MDQDVADVSKIAVAHFAAGCNCAQSMLVSFAAELGLETQTAIRLATGFGVGMARGGVCGVVSGAVMVLGLAGGGGGPGGAARKAATYARTREFYDQFIDRHGSLICRDLIGLDPSVSEGLDQARREHRFETVCVKLVSDAAAILEIMLHT